MRISSDSRVYMNNLQYFHLHPSNLFFLLSSQCFSFLFIFFLYQFATKIPAVTISLRWIIHSVWTNQNLGVIKHHRCNLSLCISAWISPISELIITKISFWILISLYVVFFFYRFNSIAVPDSLHILSFLWYYYYFNSPLWWIYFFRFPASISCPIHLQWWIHSTEINRRFLYTKTSENPVMNPTTFLIFPWCIAQIKTIWSNCHKSILLH